MTPGDLFGEAWLALRGHRLRAVLSSIGIVVGVATVVATLAVGDGARREAVAEIGSLGIDNLYVRTVKSDAPADPGRRRPPAPVLRLDDARAIGKTVPGVRAVAGVRTAHVDVRGPVRHVAADLVGVTAAWPGIVGATPLRGRSLTVADVRERREVAVLGARAAHQLFGNADPVGRRVLAGGSWRLVVGVFAGGSSVNRPRHSPIQRIDPDASVVVPFGTMDQPLGEGDTLLTAGEIAIRLDGHASPAMAAAAVAALMRRRHARSPAWALVVPRALLDARLHAQRTFSIVLVSIGALALLISGVGIMNIMLASVAERTYEIGVRRAFGARRQEILHQFAIEAMLLCLAGAVAGLPLGILLSGVVAGVAGWPVAISPLSLLLALAVALSVGLLSGVYPARLAARIDPVEALRAG